MQDQYLKAMRLIERAQKVLCISHKRPDGDTLGASSAWGTALKNMGKQVTYACADDIPEKFSFLADYSRFVKSFNFRDFDLIIVSDAAASYMTKYHDIYPGIWSGEVPIINIDHHSSNDNFGTVNIVDVDAAAATLILFDFFQYCQIPITPSMATALLCGIYYDTGSLMHGNTSLMVFDVAGRLMELGGRLHIVAKSLFRNNHISTLKLWGRALENTRVNDEGVTVSVVTWQDFEECGANPDDISGIVDMLNAVPGTKYTCLLNEDRGGNIKGSFRTRRDDVDVAEIAARFGGGGHKKAAGFTMPGKLQREVHWKIVPDTKLPYEVGDSLHSTKKLLNS